MNPTLFDTRGLARHCDPPTSRVAAETITGRTERLIVATFAAAGHGLTDDDLCGRLAGLYGPTVRTARSRLTRDGRVVDSGVLGISARGRACVVWQLGAAS